MLLLLQMLLLLSVEVVRTAVRMKINGVRTSGVVVLLLPLLLRLLVARPRTEAQTTPSTMMTQLRTYATECIVPTNEAHSTIARTGAGGRVVRVGHDVRVLLLLLLLLVVLLLMRMLVAQLVRGSEG